LEVPNSHEFVLLLRGSTFWAPTTPTVALDRRTEHQNQEMLRALKMRDRSNQTWRRHERLGGSHYAIRNLERPSRDGVARPFRFNRCWCTLSSAATNDVPLSTRTRDHGPTYWSCLTATYRAVPRQVMVLVNGATEDCQATPSRRTRDLRSRDAGARNDRSNAGARLSMRTRTSRYVRGRVFSIAKFNTQLCSVARRLESHDRGLDSSGPRWRSRRKERS